MSSSVLYDAPGPKTRRLSRIVSFVTGAVIVVGVAWFVFALGQPRETAGGATLSGLWDPKRWDIFGDPVVWTRLLWDGLVLGTLRVAGLAAVLALLLGVAFSFLRTAASPWVRVPTAIVLEFFRGMPVLLMMLFILLALATAGYWAAVGALALYNGAVLGEAFRAGIQSLPRGQREAGLSLGMTRLQTRMLIEFPQAFRQMLPIVLAQMVVLLKDTSLAYIVAYPEILKVSDQMRNFYGSRYSFSVFFVVLAVYLTVNYSLSVLARWVARRSGPGAVGGRRKGTRHGGPATPPPRGSVGTDTALMSVGMAESMTGRVEEQPPGR